jgi:hypothetical protein
VSPLATQTEQYWVDGFEITQADIDHLYSVLLEREIPLSVDEMALILVRFRIQQEQSSQSTADGTGNRYRPKNHYEVGDEIVLPGTEGQAGKVIGLRPGNNPEVGDFTVIQVEAGSEQLEYAADLQTDHALNEDAVTLTAAETPELSPEDLFIEYGGEVAAAIEERFASQDDLVRLAGRWFPRSLLAEVNIGHLNLAEAVLDMAEGGPLTTPEIIEQMGLMSDNNERLAEFSMNYGLQQDDRFDEVGPAGQVLWFLKRMEPTEVLTPPPRLAYTPIAYDRESLPVELQELEIEIGDEHSDIPIRRGPRPQSATLLLTYPHKRAGTVPLSPQLRLMFPTAYEAPRIRFTLIDAETDEEIPAWVVRPGGYVYGLKEWFADHEVPVGGYLTIQRTDDLSRVKISYARRKPRIEWVRTALVDQSRLYFENRKHSIPSEYDELMILAVEDPDAVDAVWSRVTQSNVPLDSLLQDMCRQLAPLGPQGTVHAKTLYSAVNLLCRCPPGPIFAVLSGSGEFENVGGPYWRLKGAASAT